MLEWPLDGLSRRIIDAERGCGQATSAGCTGLAAAWGSRTWLGPWSPSCSPCRFGSCRPRPQTSCASTSCTATAAFVGGECGSGEALPRVAAAVGPSSAHAHGEGGALQSQHKEEDVVVPVGERARVLQEVGERRERHAERRRQRLEDVAFVELRVAHERRRGTDGSRALADCVEQYCDGANYANGWRYAGLVWAYCSPCTLPC